MDRPGGPAIATLRSGTVDPIILYVPGYGGTKTGDKARALASLCNEHGHSLLRFDYRGTGESPGSEGDGNLSLWLEDTLAVLDLAVGGSAVLVGSSMGAWISLLAALQRPGRVRALVLIAAAADFTEANESFPDRPFIEDAKKHLLLSEPIDVPLPVRMFHGMEDETVPWRNSVRIAECLNSDNVEVTLIGDGDHRLSREADVGAIFAAVQELTTGQPA